jgi:hypothetical protein
MAVSTQSWKLEAVFWAVLIIRDQSVIFIHHTAGRIADGLAGTQGQRNDHQHIYYKPNFFHFILSF